MCNDKRLAVSYEGYSPHFAVVTWKAWGFHVQPVSSNLRLISTYLYILFFQIKDLERDFDAEVRRSNEFQKLAKKSERRLKEIAFQGDEDAKNIQRLQEQCDRLNNKIKKMRVQLDEAVWITIVLYH